MQRKPGGYRKPTEEQRERSRIEKDKFNEWFRQIWTVTGASTKNHPAPFPDELATRVESSNWFYGAELEFSKEGTSKGKLVLREERSIYRSHHKRSTSGKRSVA